MIGRETPFLSGQQAATVIRVEEKKISEWLIDPSRCCAYLVDQLSGLAHVHELRLFHPLVFGKMNKDVQQGWSASLCPVALTLISVMSLVQVVSTGHIHIRLQSGQCRDRQVNADYLPDY